MVSAAITALEKRNTGDGLWPAVRPLPANESFCFVSVSVDFDFHQCRCLGLLENSHHYWVYTLFYVSRLKTVDYVELDSFFFCVWPLGSPLSCYFVCQTLFMCPYTCSKVDYGFFSGGMADESVSVACLLCTGRCVLSVSLTRGLEAKSPADFFLFKLIWDLSSNTELYRRAHKHRQCILPDCLL